MVSKPSYYLWVLPGMENNVSDWYLVESCMIMWKIGLKSQIFLNWKKKNRHFFCGKIMKLLAFYLLEYGLLIEIRHGNLSHVKKSMPISLWLLMVIPILLTSLVLWYFAEHKICYVVFTQFLVLYMDYGTLCEL